MTQIDLSKILLDSSFSGFGNSKSGSLTYTVPSATIPVSQTWTNSTPLTIANSLSQIELQFQNGGFGLIDDSNWYIFKGFLGNMYKFVIVNGSYADYQWTNNLADANFEIDIWTSYTANSLVFTTQVFNLQLSGDLSFPGTTIATNFSLYDTPF